MAARCWLVVIAQREVPLLLEDVGGGRRLGAVRHLARGLDLVVRDLLEHPGALGQEEFARVGGSLRSVHRPSILPRRRRAV